MWIYRGRYKERKIDRYIDRFPKVYLSISILRKGALPPTLPEGKGLEVKNHGETKTVSGEVLDLIASYS